MKYPQEFILKYLIEVQLADFESDFRGVLENIGGTDDGVETKNLVIATVSVLMSIGGVKWPIIMRVLSSLRARSEEQLRSDAVAIINGSHLMLPRDDDVQCLELGSMREVDHAPSPLVSNVYSLSAVFDRVEQVAQAS